MIVIIFLIALAFIVVMFVYWNHQNKKDKAHQAIHNAKLRELQEATQSKVKDNIPASSLAANNGTYQNPTLAVPEQQQNYSAGNLNYSENTGQAEGPRLMSEIQEDLAEHKASTYNDQLQV